MAGATMANCRRNDGKLAAVERNNLLTTFMVGWSELRCWIMGAGNFWDSNAALS
jgi:hypothetical protein